MLFFFSTLFPIPSPSQIELDKSEPEKLDDLRTLTLAKTSRVTRERRQKSEERGDRGSERWRREQRERERTRERERERDREIERDFGKVICRSFIRINPWVILVRI